MGRRGIFFKKSFFLLHFALDVLILSSLLSCQLPLGIAGWEADADTSTHLQISCPPCAFLNYIWSQKERTTTQVFLLTTLPLGSCSAEWDMCCFLLQTELRDPGWWQSPWWHRGWWTCSQVKQEISKDLTLQPQSCLQAPAPTPASQILLDFQ